MKQILTSIEINSSAIAVWSCLLDFKSYPEWNPFIVSLKGKAQLGGRLEVVLRQKGSKDMKFKPKCVSIDENKEFAWLGNLLMPGIFDGEHRFQIESIGENKVRFTHSEKFKGLLLPFLWKQLDTKARAAFELMNKALKDRIETRE